MTSSVFNSFQLCQLPSGNQRWLAGNSRFLSIIFTCVYPFSSGISSPLFIHYCWLNPPLFIIYRWLVLMFHYCCHMLSSLYTHQTYPMHFFWFDTPSGSPPSVFPPGRTPRVGLLFSRGSLNSAGLAARGVASRLNGHEIWNHREAMVKVKQFSASKIAESWVP